jgi:hypothetical protein
LSPLLYLYVMKLIPTIKNILLEAIPLSALQYDTFEDLGEFHIKWYVTQHALGRTNRSANIEALTLEEIEDMCNSATPVIINLFTDKTKPYKPHINFQFQIRQQGNLYATLACVVVEYEHLKSMSVVIKTTLKSGNTLKTRFFDDNRKQMIIDI